MIQLKRINKILLTGLVAVLPVSATIYLILWLVASAEKILGGVLRYFLPENWYLPGMGVAVGLFLVFQVGLFMEMLLFQTLVEKFEGLIYRVPLIKSVYGAIREFLTFLLQGKSKGPRQVVAVNIASTGMTLIGFVTKRNLSFLDKEHFQGKVAVYIPFSYQIGGYTVLISVSDLTPLDIPIDRAMRFVMTAGIIEKDTSQKTDQGQDITNF